MNKRAQFSLAIFVFGLIFQLSTALSQTPSPQATRPRTVTAQPSPPQPVTQNPSVTPPPVTSPLLSQPPAGTAAPQPWHPLAMNKIRSRLDEAKRFLKSRPA